MGVPGNPAAGTQEVIRRTAPEESVLTTHLVAWTAQTRTAQNTGPTKSVPLGSAREPEPKRLRPGKCTQPRVCSPLSNLKPEHCRLGKHTRRERGQTQCGRDTASTPHTCQWYLLAVFLCPHSSTEQVSLNKWPPLPPCVRTEIRHWREQQMEEAKINRGNCFGSDRCNRLKPCS